MTNHKKASVVLLAAILVATSFAAAQENRGPELLRAGLHENLRGLAGQLDGLMGYAIKDLVSGDTLLFNEHEAFPTASTIKIAILLELFHQVETGKVKLDDRWPIDPKARVGGSGVLAQLSDPLLTMTAADVATLMIVLSDNFATNLCIRHLGMAAINAGLERFNLKATRLRREMMDLPAARRGDENSSTPAELMALLEGLYAGKLLAPPLAERMLAILKKNKESPLRKAIPSGIAVANKPGSLDGVRCDAGIIYLSGRPYIFVGMTKYLASGDQGEELLMKAARTAHSYFERLAGANIYGRALPD